MMRSRYLFEAGGLTIGLLAAMLFGSCTTTDLASNRTGWSDYSTITVKDYEPVGIVHVVSEEITRRGFLNIAYYHTGSRITYDLLITEAKKLGADDVINIRIDRTDKSYHGIFDWFVGSTEKCTYNANALAIKYTHAVSGYFAPDDDRSLGAGGRAAHMRVGARQSPDGAGRAPTALGRIEDPRENPLQQHPEPSNE